ncbi:unnamed protein product, partial [Tetraodon nigroviridis]
MTKLELLNTFLNDRLTAAAEEIFRAVKETVQEYQSEILRSKEENERLQRLLNVTVQRLLLQQPEVKVMPARPEAAWSPRRSLKKNPNAKTFNRETLEKGKIWSRSSHLLRLHWHPRRLKLKLAGTRAAPRPPADSLPSSTTAWSNTVKKQQRTEQQSRKQSAHLLQIKNVKSLRPVSPRPSPPSPGIQRWHSCRECGKGFSFACQLEVHMRWHTKEKPYSCSVCRKSFTTVSMLKRHHRIHTGEKPFRCHVCGKCFNQSAHLNTHFRLH